MAKDIKYRYAGSGFLPGIPARDLTDDDLATLTSDQREDVKTNAERYASDDETETGVFEAVTKAAEKPADKKGG